MCSCVWDQERERERVSVCVCVCVCMHACVRHGIHRSFGLFMTIQDAQYDWVHDRVWPSKEKSNCYSQKRCVISICLCLPQNVHGWSQLTELLSYYRPHAQFMKPRLSEIKLTALPFSCKMAYHVDTVQCGKKLWWQQLLLQMNPQKRLRHWPKAAVCCGNLWWHHKVA